MAPVAHAAYARPAVVAARPAVAAAVPGVGLLGTIILITSFHDLAIIPKPINKMFIPFIFVALFRLFQVLHTQPLQSYRT